MADNGAAGGAEGGRFGSDLAVEIMHDEGVEYVAINPGATIRGLHESVVHRSLSGGPKLILCQHEEIAVGLAHGYGKATGRMMAAAVHDVVGLQHASLAIFNAYCDKAPVLVLGGTGPMVQAERRPRIDWIHTAYLQGELVRNYVKWENQVFGVESIEGAFRRGIKAATTTPMGPVYLCMDVKDQEAPVADEDWMALGQLSGSASEGHLSPAELDELLEWLAAAERPVVLVDHYNTDVDDRHIDNLVELADAWALPIVDTTNRFNMPSGHDLYFTFNDVREELLSEADLVLALDIRDLSGALRRRGSDFERGRRMPIAPDSARVVSIRAQVVPEGSWVPDYFTAETVDHELAMRGCHVVGQLVEAVRSDPVKGPDAARVAARRERLTARKQQLRDDWQAVLNEQWDAAPIATGRLAAELRDLFAETGPERWVAANWGHFRKWPSRLWDFRTDGTRHVGMSNGGGGLGYGLTASVGVALACRDQGKIAIDVQGDGDMLYTPSALWTAAAYQLPLLVVVEDNRTYYTDAVHQREVSDARGRGYESVTEGIDIVDPNVSYVDVARGFGVWAEEPVSDPAELAGALRRAADHIIATGKPALVDVVMDMKYSGK